MKFLQICQKPPLPLTDGGCIAFHALTTGLLQAGHGVKVFTLFTDKHDFLPETMPEEYVQKTDIEGVYVDTNMNFVDVYCNFMTRDPYNLSRFFSVDVDIRLTRLLQKEKYDCIILESIFTTPYLSTIRRNVNTKVILRSHNIEHQIWNKLAVGEKNLFKRIYLSYLSKKLYKAEIESWRSVDGIACISYDDLQFTRALSQKPSYLLPVAMTVHKPVEMKGKELKVYHIGSMDWLPNLEAINGFIENTLPTVINEFPNFEFHIAGRKMPALLHDKKIPGVVSWGEVESAEAFTRNFQIMIVPLQSGSGIRIKILEAFAMGMAVISTEQGIRGIDVDDRKEYYRAESPAEWVEALRLLQDPNERERIGNNAQLFMQESYSNSKIIQPLVQFIKSIPKKMKIVVLTSRIPYPLEKGDKLRIFHQIKHLSQSHEICLICLNESTDKIDTSVLQEMVSELHIIKLAKWKIPFRMFFALFHKLPFQVTYFLELKNKQKIETIIQKFKAEHIYCQLIRTSEYVKNLFQFEKTIDYMDAFSAAAMRRAIAVKGLRKLFWKVENERAKKYERSIFDYFNNHSIISLQDRNLLAIPFNKKIEIVPNGVDTSNFNNLNLPKKHDIVFAGNMSYPPNIAAAIFLVEEILPKLVTQFPEITLLIAGANPSSEVLNLASDQVKVSGWMNDIRIAYCESRIFVAPMFIGAGMQNKILEAMSSELPVITTSLAAEAFSEKDQSKLIEANTAFEFTKAIQYYLLNEAALHSDGKNNRSYVEEKYSWKISNKKLDLCLSNQSS